MKIDKFINGYNQLTDPRLKTEYINSILCTDYIPYMRKVQFAQDCLKENLREEFVIECRTPQTYLAYIMSVLELYTSLEFDGMNKEAVYDLLQTYGLVDEIVGTLRDSGIVREYETIYNMCLRDFDTNHLSPRGFIQNQIQRIGVICKDSLEEIANLLKELDFQILKNLISK